MGKIRFLLALWAAKLSQVGLKLFRKNGSTFPGKVALKICPDFNARAKKTDKVICVTGTNGKTTVTNMTAGMLRKLGYRVQENAMGANIATGIATVLVKSVSVFNRLRTDVQVFEVDERYSRLILPALQPDYLVVTNIFRDSLKRNAHPEYIFSVINEYTPAKTKLILNADELCSAGLRPDNERVYFGIGELPGDVTEPYNLIADHCICPKCHAGLKFNYLRYHHIGHAYCPNCDFRSPGADVLATGLDGENRSLRVRMDGEETVFPLINPILFNVYNELAVITVLSAFGIERGRIRDALEGMGVVSSRLSETLAGDAVVVKAMSKGQSAVSSCRTLDFVSKEPGNKTVVLVIDDYYERKESSEFIGWIYDTDFEVLAKDDVVQVLALGPRCADYKVRLLMAGIPEERILCGAEEFAAVEKMRTDGVERIYVLYDTSTYDLACRVADRIVEKFTAVKEVSA
ncbi:MAG: MurT ligase domain-containing protein [Oscillospiraceae bacterium]